MTSPRPLAAPGDADRMAGFHARNAGVTRRAYARGRDARGRSSYALLAELAAPGMRTLDLGCGDGALLELLRARGAIAVGVDRSVPETSLARGHGVDVVAGTAIALPFAAGAFELVVSHLAFSVMDQVEVVVDEVDRVLARRGCFAAVVGGGPVARGGGAMGDADGIDGPDAFELFLELLSAALVGVARCRFGDARASRVEGWQALLGPRGFAIEWRRHEIDLSGSFEEVWTTLSSAYDCMLLRADQLSALNTRFAAACAARFGPRVPLAMVVWLGVARR